MLDTILYAFDNIFIIKYRPICYPLIKTPQCLKVAQKGISHTSFQQLQGKAKLSTL
jgi:hypothetical protein